MLTGCAPPSTLAPERSAAIHRIGVVTGIPDDSLQVFDHTGTRMTTPFIYSNSLEGILVGNLLSVVAESLVNTGIAKYKIDKSLGGTPDKTSPVTLRDFKLTLDKSIQEKLSEKYRVVSLDCLDSQGLTLLSRSQCLEKARLLDLDTLAFIDLAYGFAAYSERSASVSIDGTLIAYDVASKEIILRKALESNRTSENTAPWRSLLGIMADCSGKTCTAPLTLFLHTPPGSSAYGNDIWLFKRRQEDRLLFRTGT